MHFTNGTMKMFSIGIILAVFLTLTPHNAPLTKVSAKNVTENVPQISNPLITPIPKLNSYICNCTWIDTGGYWGNCVCDRWSEPNCEDCEYPFCYDCQWIESGYWQCDTCN
jgi:hypothetical protein